MVENLIKLTKEQHPEILEIVDVQVDESLVYGLVKKDEGKEATVVVYKVNNKNAEKHTAVTAYWKDNVAVLDIEENGSSRTVKTDYTKTTSDVTVQASFCENAINALCGFGGVAACNAACRAIPIIGVLLGFTVCRNLCASIVGDGCNAAKEQFC
ncbi:putative immunity protein/bacteriocin [Melghiribacillus thermohalophilus]|uniref:Putative immunity protein/bacteriocin n=1 Tax=Melghiribacillus thermohalophilus TaxID=1324956 RepID=A0A4R3MQY5_9BACI|nr:hypothetical protein [Melghiribacillus thermohalophilus]TCT17560.1 putative immunity protein/bacteriocin [Melghiribacillus thermohalophilus]